MEQKLWTLPLFLASLKESNSTKIKLPTISHPPVEASSNAYSSHPKNPNFSNNTDAKSPPFWELRKHFVAMPHKHCIFYKVVSLRTHSDCWITFGPSSVCKLGLLLLSFSFRLQLDTMTEVFWVTLQVSLLMWICFQKGTMYNTYTTLNKLFGLAFYTHQVDGMIILNMKCMDDQPLIPLSQS